MHVLQVVVCKILHGGREMFVLVELLNEYCVGCRTQLLQCYYARTDVENFRSLLRIPQDAKRPRSVADATEQMACAVLR